MSKQVIFYHANCTDGATAAYIALKAMPEATARPVQYSDVFPPIPEGCELFVVDFCFDYEVLVDYCKTARYVTVLDHHPKALQVREEMLTDPNRPSNLIVSADKQRCGATLAWEWFFPTPIPPPELLKYVEDYDLWRWQLEGTGAVSEYLRLEPATPEWIRHCFEHLGHDYLIECGELLLQKKDNQIDQWSEYAGGGQFNNFLLLICNAPREYASKLGGILAERSPSGCAVIWYKDVTTYCYSVRSKGKGGILTAKEVAESFGGGGHKHAASFSSPFSPDNLFNS